MVTIKDVANKAGVSVSTVSNVINNSSLVKLETRYQVLQTIKDMNYVPNQYARSLVTKQKRIIGVVKTSDSKYREDNCAFDAIIDTYLSDMLDAIKNEINYSDYSMLLDTVCWNSSINELPLIMDANRVDGMLFMMGVVSDEHVEKIKQTGIPTVLVGSRHKNLDYVDTDSEKGIYLAANYLIKNGHSDIAFIDGPDNSQSSSRKISGYKKALKEYGLNYRPELFGKGDFTGKTGYDEMKRIWECGVKPTAIIGGADAIAVGAMRFMHDIGLSCPEDISIIGFEDGLLAEYSIPPLTTIRIHKSQLGALACKVLLNRIKIGNANYVKLIDEPELIIRQSVRKLM